MSHTHSDIAAARPEELWHLAGITERTQEVMHDVLERMRKEIPFVYAHSLRVGAHAFVRGQDRPPMYWRKLISSSYLHDTGKLDVRHELFRDSYEITPEEFEEIKRHAYKGWVALKDKLPFEAAVAGMHHLKENNGYGVRFDDCLAGIPRVLWDVVRAVSREVSLADYFDASVTRNNVRDEMCVAIAREYGMTMDDTKRVIGRMRETYPFPTAR